MSLEPWGGKGKGEQQSQDLSMKSWLSIFKQLKRQSGNSPRPLTPGGFQKEERRTGEKPFCPGLENQFRGGNHNKTFHRQWEER